MLAVNSQAALYYARKKRREREEATAGRGGGLREQVDTLGLTLRVTLTLS